jgi:hypothetical protein
MGINVLTRAPSNLLSTLDRVKAELSITDTSSDDVLFDILARASSAITKECLGGSTRSFGVQTVQETIKGSGSQILSLSLSPVLAVTQVLQDTEVLNPLDPDQGYSIEDADAGALFRPCGWGQTVALLSWGWESYSSRYILPGGTQTLRYTVTYTAGYFLPIQDQYILGDRVSGLGAFYDPTAGVVLDSAIPPTVPNLPPVLNTPASLADAPPLPGDVEQACLVTVKAWWLTRQRDPSITTERSLDQQTTFNLAMIEGAALPTGALRLLRDYRKVLA